MKKIKVTALSLLLIGVFTFNVSILTDIFNLSEISLEGVFTSAFADIEDPDQDDSECPEDNSGGGSNSIPCYWSYRTNLLGQWKIIDCNNCLRVRRVVEYSQRNSCNQ